MKKSNSSVIKIYINQLKKRLLENFSIISIL